MKIIYRLQIEAKYIKCISRDVNTEKCKYGNNRSNDEGGPFDPPKKTLSKSNVIEEEHQRELQSINESNDKKRKVTFQNVDT